jgi:Photosynthetic reaction centre cytochrome C subunit
MIRSFAISAAVIILFAMSTSALFAQDAPAAGAQNKPMVMPKPVNLKVLPKDTSPDEVMKIMQAYSHQLGVNCNFCHVINLQTRHPDFASDEKPEKNTARTMMLMTQEINDKYLSQIHDPDAAPDQKTVTCGTCHRGHSMPIAFKAPEHQGPEKSATPPKP